MTAPVPSSGLSPERLEEIEYLRRVASANNGAALEHDNNNYRDCTRCRIGYAMDDLLAEVRRLQGELASAREETAQAVRAEREACAQIVDAQSQRERGWGNDDAATVLHDVRNLILFRSRSLPGEKADA